MYFNSNYSYNTGLLFPFRYPIKIDCYLWRYLHQHADMVWTHLRFYNLLNHWPSQWFSGCKKAEAAASALTHYSSDAALLT